MAEPLKNHFGLDIAQRIAKMIAAVHPAFKSKPFVAAVAKGYEELDLMARARHITLALRQFLPEDIESSLNILIQSLGPKLEGTEKFGMSPFLYLPHIFYVSDYGLEHFETSMLAQYELTQRFTAEFSIRAFIEKHPKATLDRLKTWSRDPSPHVRRLVSEGTRPRLPWAPRLRGFQKDPSPVLKLLEWLKDDPSLYVRRSVANNLNDIGKDHPRILAQTCRQWLKGASAERQWLVHHALRSAIKRGEAEAFKVLGYGEQVPLELKKTKIHPQRPSMGESVGIAFEIFHGGKKKLKALVDFQIHYVKANGQSKAKVFKLKEVELAPQTGFMFQKKISLAEMTTRKHYPGIHKVDILINGVTYPLGEFELCQK